MLHIAFARTCFGNALEGIDDAKVVAVIIFHIGPATAGDDVFDGRRIGDRVKNFLDPVQLEIVEFGTGPGATMSTSPV